MTTVYVSRHPTRSLFESVQFGNASSLEDPLPDKDFLSPLVPGHFQPLSPGTSNKNLLSPLAPEESQRTSRDRYGSITGLTMAYKRRTRLV